MLLFHQARLLMLSNPKTGTTAIENALGSRASIRVDGPPDLKHANVHRYHRYFRPMFERFVGADIEIIAAMREPVEWLGSWYRYRSRDELVGQPNSTREISFDEFVTEYVSDAPKSFARLGRQFKFLSPHKETAVHRIFAYENIGEMVEYICERLDCPVPQLTQMNVSPAGRPELSKQVRLMLEAKFPEDFELYEALSAQAWS